MFGFFNERAADRRQRKVSFFQFLIGSYEIFELSFQREQINRVKWSFQLHQLLKSYMIPQTTTTVRPGAPVSFAAYFIFKVSVGNMKVFSCGDEGRLDDDWSGPWFFWTLPGL